jgi:hypothetical protein
MVKKKTVLALALFLILTSTLIHNSYGYDPWKNNDRSDFHSDCPLNLTTPLAIEAVTYNDTLYKGTDWLHPFEWWYFDAIFDNYYSVEFHVILASIHGIGVVAPMLNIYHHGHLIKHIKKFLPWDAFTPSSHSPHISLMDTPFMKGYQDTQGTWIFNINLSLDQTILNLTYTSMTEGWKSNILGMWWWGVIQPKAQVTGTLYFDNQIIPVKGTGYQEHGWNATIPYTQGWYWGKFVTTGLNVIWTYIMLTPWSHHTLMVLNYDNGGFTLIPTTAINYTLTNYTHIDGWELPTTFSFQVQDEHLSLKAHAITQSLTHQASLAMFNYWRYHVHIQGTIQAQDHLIPLDTTQIMDYTHIW